MRFTVRARMLATAAIATLALMVVVVVSAVTASHVTDDLLSIRDQYLPKVGLRPRLEAHLERIGRSLQDAVAASDADLLAGARAEAAAFRGELDAAGSAIDPRAAASLRQEFDGYVGTSTKISERLLAGETGETIVDEMTGMQARRARVAELIQRATAFDAAQLAGAFSSAARAQDTATRILLAVSAACLVVVLVLSIGISRRVVRSVAHLTAGFGRFGGGDFAATIPVTGNDELAGLAQQANRMAERLERLASERDRGNWLKTGQAGLADALRGELDLGEVADRAVAYLARYLGAPVGALYTAGPDGAFRMLGRYAVTAGEEEPAAIRPGEGVLGQAALTDDVTVLRAPVGGRLRVASGLASSDAAVVAALPIRHLGAVTALLELVFLDDWSDERSELLRSVRDTLAVELEVARARGALRRQNDALTRQAAEIEERRRELELRNAELMDARRRLEQKADELTSASAYKSQFLANMSHELRTPLNAILGFSELLHDGAVSPDAPEHREFLRDILTSGRHLLQLINDVLDLSKVEAGKLEFRPERIAPPNLIGEVLQILRTTAAEKRIRVESQVDPALDEVFLDPARLKQILYNYVSNALKFTPEGGRVTIRALPEGRDRFRLEVEDTGVGVAAADLGRLFVEFQQIHAGPTRRQGGTGLGLALTKRLAEAQGGSVGVRSTLGEGSTFFAVLPRRATGAASLAPGASAPRRAPREASPGVRSILVIEDSDRDQDEIASALASAGYAVQVASTGAQALALCRERTFDAITLDLLLPDMSGLDVLQGIRRDGANRDVPIVVITVIAEPGAVAGFPVQDILPKPVDQEVLVAALRRAGVLPERSTSILVVDDDPGSLRLMAATLTQLGYHARCEQDAASALRSVAGAIPTAVVLDLIMPGMNGFEFLDAFRRDPRSRTVPVIVWTVKDLNDDERARLQASAQAIVSKGNGGGRAVLAQLEPFLHGGPRRTDHAG